MIFKGNASSKAEGGEIKNAYIGVDGVAREAYKIFVGDESGKAQLVYWNNTPPETAVTVSSLEEFYEKATADPYGYYIFTGCSGKWLSIPFTSSETWDTIENFYGTLDGAGVYLYAGKRLIENNYGTVKNLCFHYAKDSGKPGGNLIGNNYGHITHCMFCICQYSEAPAINAHKTGAVIDNCEAMLCYASMHSNLYDNVNSPLLNILEKGAVVYCCSILMDVFVKKNENGTAARTRKLLAQIPYSGYKDDPEVGKFFAFNYGEVNTDVANLQSARDYQFPLMKTVYRSSNPNSTGATLKGFDYTHEWVNYHGMTAWLKDMPTMYSFRY